jgi:hypothetical protein
VVAELSYITYHAGLTHFLFAQIVAEVCDASALVVIALGFSKRISPAPLVPGAAQHRERRVAHKAGIRGFQIGAQAPIEDGPPPVGDDPNPAAGRAKPYDRVSH